MPFNVNSIKNTLFATPLYTRSNNSNAGDFVKNAYAVKGNLTHPESRTNYSDNDYRGKNVYLLA